MNNITKLISLCNAKFPGSNVDRPLGCLVAFSLTLEHDESGDAEHSPMWIAKIHQQDEPMDIVDPGFDLYVEAIVAEDAITMLDSLCETALMGLA